MNWEWQGIVNAWNSFWATIDINIVLLLALVLVFILVVPRLVRWAFADDKGKSGPTGYQPNPTNGLVNPEMLYPVAIKLLELDKEQNPTEKVLGFSIRTGPKESVFLFLDGVWARLESIQSLHHLQIEKIEEEIRDGIRKYLPAPEGQPKAKREFEQVHPPGHFFLNGEAWKLDETAFLAGEIVSGQLFSFKGGQGLLVLMSASPVSHPEEGSALLLEKTIDKFRREVNEVWTSYSVHPASFEEVRQRVGDKVLAELKFDFQPA